VYKGTETTFVVTEALESWKVVIGNVEPKNLMPVRSNNRNRETRGHKDQALVGHTAQLHYLLGSYQSW
jgi:hypothetical protein